MLGNERIVTLETLVREAEKARDEGYRFLTATCIDMGEQFEIIYHLDRDLVLCNIRVIFAKSEAVSSLSGIWLCAVIIENEMKELFGARIEGIAIDYGGMLYSTAQGPGLPMVKQMKVVVSRNQP